MSATLTTDIVAVGMTFLGYQMGDKEPGYA
jgi:hypothetical protein